MAYWSIFDKNATGIRDSQYLLTVALCSCSVNHSQENNGAKFENRPIKSLRASKPEHATNSTLTLPTGFLVANRSSASKQSTFTVKTSDEEKLLEYFSSERPSKSFQVQQSSEE